MTVELVRAAPKPLEFSLDGTQLYSRKLPFRLAMQLGGDEITAEVMADIIVGCVVNDDNKPVFESAEQVLEHDSDQMIKLFQAVSEGMVSTESARKNSKASRR